MPVPRPAVALRAANALSYSTRLTASSQATTQQQCVRSFSSSRQQLAAGHGAHEDHYDPPGGWLWGLDPSKKHEKEGWENIFFYGFFGSLGLSVIAYAFKPDTSIQTWALEEARRRLEVEGILKEPENKS